MSDASFLLCQVGEHSIAIPADTIQAIHDNVTFLPVCDTVNWFLGLAVVKGKLLPITDLAFLFTGKVSSGHILEVKPAYGKAGLRVDAVMGVHSSTQKNYDIQPIDSTLPHDVGLSLFAIEHDSTQYRVMELSVLLQSRRFLNINAESEFE